MDKEKNILESALEGKRESDLFTTINLIPFLNIILFIVSIILLPFNLKKFFKLKEQNYKPKEISEIIDNNQRTVSSG